MNDVRTTGLRGLLGLLLLALALFSVAPAHAAFPATSGGTPPQCAGLPSGPSPSTDPDRTSNKFCVPTGPGSADYVYGWSYSSTVYGWPGLSFPCGDNTCRTGIGGDTVGYLRNVPSPMSCPANSTLSGSSCTCTAPAVESATHDSCIAKPTVDPMIQICDDESAIQNSTFTMGVTGQWVYSPGVIAMHDSCNTNMEGVPAGRGCTQKMIYDRSEKNAKGEEFTVWHPQFTAQPCNTEPMTIGIDNLLPTPQPGTVSKCAAGTMPGTASMNGTTVELCTQPISTTAPGKKTETPTPTGTQKTAEQIACDLSTCTTTTTTTDTNSSTGATTTTTSSSSTSKGDYCDKNPKAGACGGSSSSGCPEGSSTVACMSVGTPVDGVVPTNEVNMPTVGQYNMAGFQIGNTCPVDQTLTLPGINKTISMSFKGACDAAPMVNPLVLLGSAFAALMIVYGALTAKS